MNWLVLSLVASTLWGLSYVLDEKLFKVISVSTLLLWSSMATMATMSVVGLATGTLQEDMAYLGKDRSTLLTLVTACVCNVLAGYCICASVAAANATLAGLIEITYPLAIVFFSMLILGTAHLNWAVGVGGALIGLGVVVVQKWGMP